MIVDDEYNTCGGARADSLNAVVTVDAIGAVGLGFDSKAGQIGRSVAKDSPPLQCFFGAALPRCYAASEFATRYTLRA